MDRTDDWVDVVCTRSDTSGKHISEPARNV
jgi:hypothetical protein